MNNTNPPIVVDCTLRDGGYYCSWNFCLDLVNEYLFAMSSAGINYVEIGFRSTQAKGFKGPFAFCKDEFIDILRVPKDLKLGVMVNASELPSAYDELNSTLSLLFPDKSRNLQISLVRIAFYIEHVGVALAAADWLGTRGYEVGINLMQIKSCSAEQIKYVAQMSNSHHIDVLYFADSLGSLRPDAVGEIISLLRTYWKGSLGIHTHDNLGLALSNTLTALKSGAQWLDSTVGGMGRGPGNAKTEELLVELGFASNDEKRSIAPLFKLASDKFDELRIRYKWGTNPYYFLAAKYGIHPSYVQEMLGDSRYEEAEIISALEQLRLQSSKKFNFDALSSTRQLIQGKVRGTWNPSGFFDKRDLLLLGSGSEATQHVYAIQSYIKSHHPVVLALNTKSLIDEELIDLRISCHPVRLLADLETLSLKSQPLITPRSMLSDTLSSKLSEKTVLDYGLVVKQDCFKICDTHCLIPSPLVLAYALAVAAAGDVKRILMVGFDGYQPGDARNDEVESTLSCFRSNFPDLDLISLTPTSYKLLTSQSIYNF